jgi:hypothetical protein
MIGSIDIFASSTIIAVTSSAATTPALVRRTADDDAVCTRRFASRWASKSSRTKKMVHSAATAIIAPPAKNVPRMPIQPGKKPPTSGPIRLPASAPVDKMPNAQPARSRGA